MQGQDSSSRKALPAAKPVIASSTGQGTKPAVSKPIDLTPFVMGIKVYHTSAHQDTDAQKLNEETRKHRSVAYPGNIIRFTIAHPYQFLLSRPTDNARIVLFINGVEMHGITADWYSSVTNQQLRTDTLLPKLQVDSVNIVLVRNKDSQLSWDFLYNNTTSLAYSFIKIDGASIGWENMAPLGRSKDVPIIIIAFYYRWEFWVWIFLFGTIICLFLVLALRTDVIRESKKGPYSLSYTQLLFWTALIMGAFIYTLLLTDISTTFNSSVLYLMGISLSTTGFAGAIDRHKLNKQTAVPKKHTSFIEDLLTDGSSYSVQRIQAFAWNLILGVYFVIYTVTNKTMPEFSTTLLFLAGFSSTSYLAAKLPENTAVPPKAPISGDSKLPSKAKN